MTSEKGVAEYIMPLYPPFWRPFKTNGGDFQSNTSISEITGTEPSFSTLAIDFVGRRFQKKFCRIHHAIESPILEAIFLKWRPSSKQYHLYWKL